MPALRGAHSPAFGPTIRLADFAAKRSAFESTHLRAVMPALISALVEAVTTTDHAAQHGAFVPAFISAQQSAHLATVTPALDATLK